MNIPGNPLNILSSTPNLVEIISVNFTDVAGIDEAKYELQEIVDFLKYPDRYQLAGAKIPTGVLLEGPPGTGKTLLARAIAGEANVSFISASGSEFIEMFVGVGAARVRKLFETAAENKPCIIFIDEIDAIGRQRGTGVNGGNDEREQTLNQILTNMDGFDKQDGIIVVGATNRADILDSALKRPGRFDRIVKVSLPDRIGREEIFKVHFMHKIIDKQFNFTNLALLTSGFSGADIANLANEAAILTARENRTIIQNEDAIKAFEKITIGLPSYQDTRTKETQELVAFHEAGHAMLVLFFNEFFDLKRITINSNKNGAGGYTLFTTNDKFLEFPTKKYLLATLIVSLGGRAAEILLNENTINTCKNYNDSDIFTNFKDLYITTGASGDLQQVYRLARDYVTQYGLAENLYYESSSNNQPFLGRELAMSSSKISELTKENIDAEVQTLVDHAMKQSLRILRSNYKLLDDLANILIDKITVSYDDINDNLLDSNPCMP